MINNIYSRFIFYFFFLTNDMTKNGQSSSLDFKIDNKLLNLAFAQIASRPEVSFNEDWNNYFFFPLFDPRQCTYISLKSWLETEPSLII